MNSKVKYLLVIQLIIIIVMFWLLVFYGKDEYDLLNTAQEEEIETINRITEEHGASVVVISQEAQKQSDIRTEHLTTSARQQKLNVLGTVLNIDALIELRTRYLNARANANIARAALVNSQQEYKRMQQLNQDNRNISDQVVLSKEAAYKADQAKLTAAELEAKNLQDTMRQNWGSKLASLATDDSANNVMQGLLKHQSMLILVAYPLDNKIPNGTVQVIPIGAEIAPIQANLLAEAPITDATVQGVTYYYVAPATQLRADMKVNVIVPQKNLDTESNGWMVPSSAVVWYGGKAWIYKKTQPDRFMRLPINTDNPVTSGWHVESTELNGLSADDEIVMSGAQLLLSEEFKYQIKNENED